MLLQTLRIGRRLHALGCDGMLLLPYHHHHHHSDYDYDRMPTRLNPHAFPTSDELNHGEYDVPLQRVRRVRASANEAGTAQPRGALSRP